MRERPVTPRITIADQPTAEEIRALPSQGYKAVVNLRHDGEPEQPLSTAEEGDLVREAGLEYLSVPVGAPPLSAEGVRDFLDLLDRHAEDRVLVHCRRGGRAVALVLVRQARDAGWSAAEALQRGEEAGLKVEGRLREMVQAYLEAHPPVTRA